MTLVQDEAERLSALECKDIPDFPSQGEKAAPSAGTAGKKHALDDDEADDRFNLASDWDDPILSSPLRKPASTDRHVSHASQPGQSASSRSSVQQTLAAFMAPKRPKPQPQPQQETIMLCDSCGEGVDARQYDAHEKACLVSLASSFGDDDVVWD